MTEYVTIERRRLTKFGLYSFGAGFCSGTALGIFVWDLFTR